MRKVHYKVILDVFTHEEDDEDTNGVEALETADFWPTVDNEDVDVQDVTIEDVRVTDSR